MSGCLTDHWDDDPYAEILEDLAKEEEAEQTPTRVAYERMRQYANQPLPLP